MKKGFTLVELSIVLVIIGLLIGGILVAQSMIQTTKIQRLIRDLSQYEIAVSNFKLNYKYFPGDAPSFTPAGNGNDALDSNATCTSTYSNEEEMQSFAHLSEAQMIATKYVPYTPVSCGGTMNDDAITGIGGVVLPYTTLDSKASTAFNSAYSYQTSIYPITVVKANASTNLFLVLLVNAYYVAPLEVKLPLNNGSGIFNWISPLAIPGSCLNLTAGYSQCTADDAGAGILYYYMSPM